MAKKSNKDDELKKKLQGKGNSNSADNEAKGSERLDSKDNSSPDSEESKKKGELTNGKDSNNNQDQKTKTKKEKGSKPKFTDKQQAAYYKRKFESMQKEMNKLKEKKSTEALGSTVSTEANPSKEKENQNETKPVDESSKGEKMENTEDKQKETKTDQSTVPSQESNLKFTVTTTTKETFTNQRTAQGVGIAPNLSAIDYPRSADAVINFDGSYLDSKIGVSVLDLVGKLRKVKVTNPSYVPAVAGIYNMVDEVEDSDTRSLYSHHQSANGYYPDNINVMLDMNIGGVLFNNRDRIVNNAINYNEGFNTIEASEVGDSHLRYFYKDVNLHNTLNIEARLGNNARNAYQQIQSNLALNPIIPGVLPTLPGDFDSAKWKVSIQEILKSISTFVEKPDNKSEKYHHIIQNPDLVMSLVYEMTTLSTLLYIIADSIVENINNTPIVLNKFGKLDPTMKWFITLNTVNRKLIAGMFDTISKFNSIFPVNSEVISAWNALKNPGKLNDKDWANEYNSLVAPVFRIAFPHIDTSPLHQVRVRPHMSQAGMTILTGGWINSILSLIQNHFGNDVTNYFDINFGNLTRPVNISRNFGSFRSMQSREFATISAVRMTTFVANFIYSYLNDLERGSLSETLKDIINRGTQFIDYLSEIKPFENTIFKFMETPKFDQKMKSNKSPDTLKVTPLLPLFTTTYLLNNNETRVPFYTPQQTLQNDFRVIQNVATYSERSEIDVQIHTKMMLGQPNNIQAIYLTSCIISPWHIPTGTRYNWRPIPGYGQQSLMHGDNYEFGQGALEAGILLQYLPISFEWAGRKNPLIEAYNVTQGFTVLVPHNPDDHVDNYQNRWNYVPSATAEWYWRSFNNNYNLNSIWSIQNNPDSLTVLQPFNDFVRDTKYGIRRVFGIEQTWIQELFTPRAALDYANVVSFDHSIKDVEIK